MADDTTKFIGNLEASGLVIAQNGLVMNGTTGPQFETGIDAANIEAKGVEVLRFFQGRDPVVAAAVYYALVGVSGSIVAVRANLRLPPAGAAMILDVNKNGTTVFTTQANRPTIAIGQSGSPAAVPDVVSVAAGDVLSIDVDQVGSGDPGFDLTVAIAIKHSLVD